MSSKRLQDCIHLVEEVQEVKCKYFMKNGGVS